MSDGLVQKRFYSEPARCNGVIKLDKDVQWTVPPFYDDLLRGSSNTTTLTESSAAQEDECVARLPSYSDNLLGPEALHALVNGTYHKKFQLRIARKASDSGNDGRGRRGGRTSTIAVDGSNNLLTTLKGAPVTRGGELVMLEKASTSSRKLGSAEDRQRKAQLREKLTEDEMRGGESQWVNLKDPFPSWTSDLY